MNTNTISSTPLLSDNDFTNSERLFKTLDRPTQEQKKAIAHIYTEQAFIYAKEHNWRKAVMACKNALEIAPDTAEAYGILGNILERQGKKAEALGIYAKALTINPNSATVYANLGNWYAERKQWQKALDYYQQAVILDPELAETYLDLAWVWEELGETEKALECFCRAINMQPAILPAEEYFSFGQELYQQGKLKEASILYSHGIKLNPQAERELAQLVQILEELEEWQEAVVYYNQLISLPDSPSDRSNSPIPSKPIGKLLAGIKTRSISQPNSIIAKNTQRQIPSLSEEVALKLLPKTKSLNNPTQISVPDKTEIEAAQPDSALSWNNLGSLYAQKQQWTKAIGCYQEALQLDPNFAKSYRNLARVHNNLGEEQKAALYWYEAFTIAPDLVKPEAYFSLANKLIQHQQPDKAIACLHRTIELKPSFSQAYLILGKLLANQGKTQEAEACYAKLARR